MLNAISAGKAFSVNYTESGLLVPSIAFFKKLNIFQEDIINTAFCSSARKRL